MELDAEIFAVGKWNGFFFTLDDLNKIADTFNKLKEVQDVPLKLGHNDKQPLTDGQPALGWVDKVWVAGEKLMAHYMDMPKVVYEAVSKKLYKNVSIELDIDVKYKGVDYPYVLSGIALLGADIPAVNTLKDLTHYMSRGADFSAGRKVMFSAIAGQSRGGIKMEELQALTKKVAELTTQVATFTTDKATLSAENADLKAKVAKFEADAKAKAEADAKAVLSAKRVEITAVLEDGVKRGVITPAQRAQYAKVFRIDDDAAVAVLDIAEVKTLLTASSGKQFSKEQGMAGASDDGAELPVDKQVIAECNVLMEKGEAKTFAKAQEILFMRNPKLARAYADFNNKE